MFYVYVYIDHIFLIDQNSYDHMFL